MRIMRISRKARGRATIAGAVALATAAVVAGASVTASAMATTDTPEGASSAVVVGVAVAGTDGDQVDGYQCTFTDLPGFDPVPIEPADLQQVIDGTESTAGSEAMAGNVEVATGGIVTGAVADDVDVAVGEATAGMSIAPPIAGAPDLSEAQTPIEVVLDDSANGGMVREGTADECAALRATMVP